MNIDLGAYFTQMDALIAMQNRPEPQEQLEVIQDMDDPEHSWRVVWHRID
jgi:hypothetical protein